nr:hypothetical protein [Actinomycetota bacterium]
MSRLSGPRRLSVITAALGIAVWFAPDASALSSVREGWWAKWQQPTEVVGITLPGTVPTPPTADPDGLTIARDATSEAAVAALRFEVEEGAEATLYLNSYEGRDLVLPEDADVKACVSTREWEAERNAPYSKAPSWGGECTSGFLNEAQPGFVFNLPLSMQGDGGVFDVVIVPGGSAPYMVNFAATDDTTLVPGEVEATTTTTSSTTTTTEPPATTTTTTEPVAEVTDPIVYTDIPPTDGGGTALPVVTTAAPPAPKSPPTSLVAFDPTALPRALLPDTRMERIMAVSLLF